MHTLEMVPRNWYTIVKLRRVTIEWEYLVTNFTHTFEFTSEHLIIDVALQKNEGKYI